MYIYIICLTYLYIYHNIVPLYVFIARLKSRIKMFQELIGCTDVIFVLSAHKYILATLEVIIDLLSN